MKVLSKDIVNGERLPDYLGFCVCHEGEIRFGDNKSPHLVWSDFPNETECFAIVCSDQDAPIAAEDINVEGRVIPADLRRVVFYHWVIFNIPKEITEIFCGQFSSGVTPRGKGEQECMVNGAVQCMNNYTDWFAGDPQMDGDYFGYDGPCPPWNDELIHRYEFTVYALSKKIAYSPGYFRAGDVVKSITENSIDSSMLSGVYTLNHKIY